MNIRLLPLLAASMLSPMVLAMPPKEAEPEAEAAKRTPPRAASHAAQARRNRPGAPDSPGRAADAMAPAGALVKPSPVSVFRSLARSEVQSGSPRNPDFSPSALRPMTPLSLDPTLPVLSAAGVPLPAGEATSPYRGPRFLDEAGRSSPLFPRPEGGPAYGEGARTSPQRVQRKWIFRSPVAGPDAEGGAGSRVELPGMYPEEVRGPVSRGRLPALPPLPPLASRHPGQPQAASTAGEAETGLNTSPPRASRFLVKSGSAGAVLEGSATTPPRPARGPAPRELPLAAEMAGTLTSRPGPGAPAGAPVSPDRKAGFHLHVSFDQDPDPSACAALSPAHGDGQGDDDAEDDELLTLERHPDDQGTVDVRLEGEEGHRSFESGQDTPCRVRPGLALALSSSAGYDRIFHFYRTGSGGALTTRTLVVPAWATEGVPLQSPGGAGEGMRSEVPSPFATLLNRLDG